MNNILLGVGAWIAMVLPSPLQAQSSDTADLAAGYATAFRELRGYRAVIVYLGETETERIRNIRSVRAYCGVLLVTNLIGGSRILDPARIEQITDQ
jgi:hypothetical protein